MSSIYLSVVIPCFDEMANLQKGVLDKVKRFLDNDNFAYEVIIVDDGSRDGSTEFIRQFTHENPAFQLIENKHSGKAGAVTTGVLAAKGSLILFTDMDQATPIEEVNKLLPFFDQDYEIVIGSRKGQRKGAPVTRKFISLSSIVLRKLIVGLTDISDTQCGFKMFRNVTAKKLFERVSKIHHGFSQISGSSVSSGFDVELLYLAEIMGYKIKEVPVTWLYVESRRVNPIQDSIFGILDLLKIKKNVISGKYKNL